MCTLWVPSRTHPDPAGWVGKEGRPPAAAVTSGLRTDYNVQGPRTHVYIVVTLKERRR